MPAKKNAVQPPVAEEPKAPNPQSKAVTTTQMGAGVPSTNAELEALMEADAGKGASGKAEDNIVPLIYILQPLSPQVNERDPNYIQGAKPGDIWLRSAPDDVQVIKGDSGFEFQPCGFAKDIVEWMPNRGGYVGRHDFEKRPPDAKEVPSPTDPTRMITVRANGNLLVETRYHAGFVCLPDGRRLPYVIPFASSGHTVSREWTFRINSKQMKSGKPYPAFAFTYHLTTKQKTNKKGTWFIFDIEDGGKDTDTGHYMAGRGLNNAFESGEVRADAPEAEASEAGGAAQDDNAAM
jgi:hypothetical protein